jgi:hypothetical protein
MQSSRQEGGAFAKGEFFDRSQTYPGKGGVKVSW